MTYSLMNTRIRSLNAAFLREIKEDNVQLRVLVDSLSNVVRHRQVTANHWPDLQKLLADLRDQLAFHFALEEGFGYLGTMVDDACEYRSRAEKLRREHADFFQEVCALADAAEDACPGAEMACESVRRRTCQFLERFRRHEAAEERLIYDTLDRDLGVGD